jgi:photosystem II stability/assembly factor-like uncharacterized protein
LAQTKSQDAVAEPQLWRISQEGALQRWTPDGQWTRVLADQLVSFTAVSVVRNDIWAGGTEGALFQSTDGGEHWSRVELLADGQPSRQTIRSIRFENPPAGQLTMDSGETWSTSDGGKTWSRTSGTRD